MARFGLVLVLAGAVSAWGQTAISAHSGMIHYVEGTVTLEGQPVEPKFGEFPEVKNDQVLQTADGRTEVLLTPGVFLRLAENSSIKMLSNRLSDTAIEVKSGSAMFEVDELLKDNAITVKYKDVTVALGKEGLYRFDSDPGRLKVYAGQANVISGLKTVEAHKGKQVVLDETLLASSFDTKETDAFYRWGSRRSEYVAAANISSARAAGASGCNGFATSTSSPCVTSPYGSPYGSWSWNPYFGMFTYLPGLGYGYNPYGWAFYSPYTVGMLYVPGYYPYGGYGYGPTTYSNRPSGPTAVSNGRQSPASLSANSNEGLARTAPGSSAAGASNSGASSGGVRSLGGGSSGSSSAGGGVSSAGGGGARSSGGGGGGAVSSGGGGGGRR